MARDYWDSTPDGLRILYVLDLVHGHCHVSQRDYEAMISESGRAGKPVGGSLFAEFQRTLAVFRLYECDYRADCRRRSEALERSRSMYEEKAAEKNSAAARADARCRSSLQKARKPDAAARQGAMRDLVPVLVEGWRMLAEVTKMNKDIREVMPRARERASRFGAGVARASCRGF